jgi:hypothetical protein
MQEVTQHMKAPRGVRGEGAANIMGHVYDVPKDGILKLVNPDHKAVLERHGFVTHETTEDLAEKIDGTEDKVALVIMIEEHGGEADEDMSLKKLRKLAKEVAGVEG